MKSTKILYTLLLFVFLFTSCEEKVELDLDTATPALVIDAILQEDSVCIVSLTKTQGYYDQARPPKVKGATVKLTTVGGASETLTEVSDGLYKSTLTRGIVKNTYNLEITVEGVTYTSTSTINQAPPIDTLYIRQITLGGRIRNFPQMIFLDPADVKNYYFAYLFVNDRKFKFNFPLFFDDEYKSGIPYPVLFMFNDKDDGNKSLAAGDKIRVDLHSMDQGAYTFYDTLYAITSGTNPTTNFTGGKVLGCFNTFSVSSKELVLKESDIVND